MLDKKIYDAITHHLLGNHDSAQTVYQSLLKHGDGDFCVAIVKQILAASPEMVEVHQALGGALMGVGQVKLAKQAFEYILETHPTNGEAAINLGEAYSAEGNFVAAEGLYRQALAISGASRYTLVLLGMALVHQLRLGEAILCFREALVLEPDAIDAKLNLAAALFDLCHFTESQYFYSSVLEAQPDNAMAAGSKLACSMLACDWSSWSDEKFTSLMRGQQLAPFWTLMLSNLPAEQLLFARKHANEQGMTEISSPRCPTIERPDGKIRIGYLSADFHSHATAFLIAELIEIHDRTRFHVIGISCGPDDGSAVRQRLVNAFDAFVDIRDANDSIAALWIEALDIDILIDLKGYTKNTRSALLALRPSPITVSYLGYPGTMGADCVDYIIADSTVLPLTDQQYYTEQIVHLPDCYQVNDSKIETPKFSSTRAEHGLPAGAFVFCCFNANPKITPQIFASWMRLLVDVEKSVLWLYRSNIDAERNLLLAAQRHGVDPKRLIFAPLQEHALHLERYRHADLFLDTCPCNAHTTASDALRMGVPLVTLRGMTFAGRVAASLLSAIGVSELIAETQEQYEAIALSLAKDSNAMSAIKRKITDGVSCGTLFDTPRFARNIEAAYKVMYQYALAGEAPKSFAVAAQ